MVWLDFRRNFVWSIFILIFTFVKIITGDLFTKSELPGKWNIYVHHFGIFWKILKQFWLDSMNNFKMFLQMSKWKETNFLFHPVLENNLYQVVCVQNFVLNLRDWTELHGICVLKTAPKVSKRKTMLMNILGIKRQF